MPKINDFCENYYEVELFDHDRMVDGFCEYGDIETIVNSMDFCLQDYEGWENLSATISYFNNVVAVMPHLDEPECEIVMSESKFEELAHVIGTRKSKLAEFSTQELYNELYNREHIAPIIWVDDDIKDSLSEHNIEPTDENVKRVWKSLGNRLIDHCIAAGWDYIEACIDSEFKEV